MDIIRKSYLLLLHLDLVDMTRNGTDGLNNIIYMFITEKYKKKNISIFDAD